MNQTQFEKAVADLPFARVEFFESVGSTNDVVAAWAREGSSGLCLAAADEQTQGRGRSGRRWVTPRGRALAFSVLLETGLAFDAALLGRASGLGALAVCEALERLGLSPQIKWPNDVLTGGRKLCGVLPEAHWSGERLQALILGIGINVAAKALPSPDALAFPATSIEEATGTQVAPEGLLRSVLERLLAWRPRMGTPDFLEAWESRLAYKGQRVQLEVGGRTLEAELIGLATDGGLKLLVNGTERAFQAGEVQLRPLVDRPGK